MLLQHLKNQRIKTKLFLLLEEKKKRLPILEGSTGGIKIVTARDNTPQEAILGTLEAFNVKCGH